jgi:hypothetical protein
METNSRADRSDRVVHHASCGDSPVRATCLRCGAQALSDRLQRLRSLGTLGRDQALSVIEIPIQEFLAGVIEASVPDALGKTDYPAILVVAARTSDASELQEDLYENWESLDDMTKGAMLIIAPLRPGRYQHPSRDNLAGVRFGYELAAAPNLHLSRRPGLSWRARFAHAASLPRHPEYSRDLGEAGADDWVAVSPEDKKGFTVVKRASEQGASGSPDPWRHSPERPESSRDVQVLRAGE